MDIPDVEFDEESNGFNVSTMWPLGAEIWSVFSAMRFCPVLGTGRGRTRVLRVDWVALDLLHRPALEFWSRAP